MPPANNPTDSAAYVPPLHAIAEMYARWTLDLIVELACAISNDFIQRPRHYRQIPEDVADILAELRASIGSRPDLPDASERAAIYGALLERSEFRVASAALRESATTFSREVSEKNEEILRQAFVDRAITLRAYLNSLEGQALSNGHKRTGVIFTNATKVLSCPEVARAFGLSPALGPDWPLGGDFSGDGAYLVQEIARTLSQPLAIKTFLGFATLQFATLQRAAHYGALALSGVLDESSGWENSNRIDALIRSAYSWANVAEDLRIETIRAWRDPEYRLSMSEAARALLPDHPGGKIELPDALMGTAVRPMQPQTLTVSGEICCSTGDLSCDSVTEHGPFCTFYCNSVFCCVSVIGPV